MASPRTPSAGSRELTPSSSSAHSMALDRTTSSSASVTGSSQDQPPGHEDVDRFLKRMDMEKTMHALQRRLEMASVKASNGWTEMSIGEIETHLPQPATPQQDRRRSGTPRIVSQPQASTSQIPYEPPSPSRPWQLIDVLWQPLPPPSHARYPGSPSSPRKRSKLEGIFPRPPTANGHHHRRASSSAFSAPHPYLQPFPNSPVRELREGEKKRRSQSHSLTTRQDVDAAKALTFMLESGSPMGTSMQAPALPSRPAISLPLPPSFQPTPPRRRAVSGPTSPESPLYTKELGTPSSHARSQLHKLDIVHGRDAAPPPREEDDSAAELMMFLAHSPSRMKRDSEQNRPNGVPARVLFADSPGPGAPGPGIGLGIGELEENGVKVHSNLRGEPITAGGGSNQTESGFGGMLAGG